MKKNASMQDNQNNQSPPGPPRLLPMLAWKMCVGAGLAPYSRITKTFTKDPVKLNKGMKYELRKINKKKTHIPDTAQCCQIFKEELSYKRPKIIVF